MVCPRPLEMGCGGICVLKCPSWGLAVSFGVSATGVVSVLAVAAVGAAALLLGGNGVVPVDDVALIDMLAFPKVV